MSETNKASNSFPIREPESLPAPSEFDCMCNADLRAVAISQSETIKAQGEEIEKLQEELNRWRKGYNTITRAHYDAELSKVKQERDEAYERAALLVDMGRGSKAIRALKSEPTDEE